MSDTGLSRTSISGLYAFGTAASAIMVLVVSRLVDRLGARLMLATIALAFGAACFGMAFAAGPIGVLLGFAALRALGQGSLPVTATLLTAQWFVRRRGRAMALVGMGFAVSNAALPPLIRVLIDAAGWRQAYMVLGVMIWALLIPAAALIVRNRPEEIGLYPDGATEPPEHERSLPPAGAQERPRNVLRTSSFWLLAIPLTAGPFIITALVFHQVSIFAERGLGPGIAAGVFVPFAVAAAATTAVGGFWIERSGPRRLLFCSLGLLLLGLIELQFLATPLTAIIYVITIGAAMGLQGVIVGVAWAHYYGRQGLGRVQGTAAMVNISTSAIAPLPLAALQQAFGGYAVGLALMMVLPVLCAITLVFFKPPKG